MQRSRRWKAETEFEAEPSVSWNTLWTIQCYLNFCDSESESERELYMVCVWQLNKIMFYSSSSSSSSSSFPSSSVDVVRESTISRFVARECDMMTCSIWKC